MKKVLAALVACVVCASVFCSGASAADIASNQWTGNYDTISSVYPASSGFIVIMTSDTYAGHTNSCNGGRQFEVPISHPNYDVMAKTLLSAYLAGHKVTFYWTSSTTCRATVDRFQVIP